MRKREHVPHELPRVLVHAVPAYRALALVPTREGVTRIAVEVAQKMMEIGDANVDVPARAVPDVVTDQYGLDESPRVRLDLHDPARPGGGDGTVVVTRLHPRESAHEVPSNAIVRGPAVEQPP